MDNLPSEMPRLETLARNRLIQWMDANRHITQKQIAEAVPPHEQGWVSKYRHGLVTASIDELDSMAKVFGHTLAELVDLRPDPKERELLEAYRRVPAERRHTALETVQAMGPLFAPRHKPKSKPDK